MQESQQMLALMNVEDGNVDLWEGKIFPTVEEQT